MITFRQFGIINRTHYLWVVIWSAKCCDFIKNVNWYQINRWLDKRRHCKDRIPLKTIVRSWSVLCHIRGRFSDTLELFTVTIASPVLHGPQEAAYMRMLQIKLLPFHKHRRRCSRAAQDHSSHRIPTITRLQFRISRYQIATLVMLLFSGNTSGRDLYLKSAILVETSRFISDAKDFVTKILLFCKIRYQNK